MRLYGVIGGYSDTLQYTSKIRAYLRTICVHLREPLIDYKQPENQGEVPANKRGFFVSNESNLSRQVKKQVHRLTFNVACCINPCVSPN